MSYAAASAMGRYAALSGLAQGQKVSAAEDPGRTRRGAKGRTGVSRGYANSQQKIQDALARQAAAQAQQASMLQKYYEDLRRREVEKHKDRWPKLFGNPWGKTPFE